MDWPLVGRGDVLAEVLEILRDRAGVLLAGPAGVGKSRLVEEIVGRLTAQGTAVHVLRVTASDRALPLGVLSHWLPATPPRTNDQIELLGLVRETLRERLADGVVVLEDAHEFDDASAAVVHQLAASEPGRLLLTGRTGQPWPQALTALWKDGHVHRRDLEPLQPPEVRELAEAALGGPIEEATHTDLWRWSGGNPLYLREVLLGAQERDQLVWTGRTWRLAGSLRPSRRVAELVDERLRQLPEPARRAAELVAVAHRISFEALLRLASHEAVEVLEQRDLLVAERRGRRTDARLAHPLYVETIRHELSTARTNELVDAIADELERTGARRSEDLLWLGRWIVETGRSASVPLRLRAAERALALHQPVLAQQLAEPVWDQDRTAAAGVLLGTALAAQGRWDDAETTLAAAQAAADPPLRARAGLARARNLFLGLGRPGDAHQLLETLRREVHEPFWRAEVEALAALFAGLQGDLRAAADAGERLLEHGANVGPTGRSTLAMSSLAHVMLGRLDAAQRHLDEAGDIVVDHDHALPFTGELLGANQVLLDAHAGRITAASERAAAAHRAALERQRHRAAGVWAAIAGWLLIFEGRLATAERRAAEAVALLEQHGDILDLAPTAHGVAAVAACSSGNADRAGGHLRALDVPGLLPRNRVYADRAAVWAAAAAGRLDAAVEQALGGGRRAVEGDHLVWAALLLHDGARLGRPEVVVDALCELAGEVEGDLVPALVDHAVSLVAGDAARLDAVVHRFEELGALLYATEAAAQAVRHHRAEGRRAHAERSTRRLVDLLHRTESVTTPAVGTDVGALEPLTPRERQIAFMAARGRTSREIAVELDLSRRTVDNHLARVYRKLGVAGREELASRLPT